MLDSVSNQPSKFKTKNWVKINDKSRGVYTTGSNIKFKTRMLRSSLCDYADACILVQVTIIIAVNEGTEPDPDPPRTAAQLLAARQADERNEGVIFKNCALFIKCISEINNAEIDYAQDIDIVMSMYNLIEHSDNYSEASGKLR